jgi:hypothetical protein
LLVKPSNTVKAQFQEILSRSPDDLNVFIFDEPDSDISWLLSVFLIVDCVIIDVDNCDIITQKFITFMLSQPTAYYITMDEVTPYSLISKNRIYNLDWIIEKMKAEEKGLDDESEE